MPENKTQLRELCVFVHTLVNVQEYIGITSVVEEEKNKIKLCVCVRIGAYIIIPTLALSVSRMSDDAYT